MVSLLRSLSLYWATGVCRTTSRTLARPRSSLVVGGLLFSTIGMSSSAPSLAAAASHMPDTGYLNAHDAAALDAALMSVPGYTLEQLMELAGLAVAQAVYEVLSTPGTPSSQPRILIICGPGNNGGDGLVAARHLQFFGYPVRVVYPPLHSVRQAHYRNLLQQCRDVGIPITEDLPEDWDTQYSVIIDAIFGFSFRGAPRPPYDAILQQLQSLRDNPAITTVAIDVPSGWDVDGADFSSEENLFVPDVLVSLTVPKLCAQHFSGRHFVGGRFLPPHLAQQYGIRMPNYPGVAQVVEVTHRHIDKETSPLDDDWEIEYARYLAEKESNAQPASLSTPAMQPADDSWEAQYAAYCAEKEAQWNAQEEQQTKSD